MSPAQGAGSAGKPAKSGKGGTIRLGTRGSALALAQSGWVADRLRSLTGREVELIQVTTHGDVTRQSLSSLGGTGVFATALREELLADKFDLVVHSLKDLPTAEAPGLRIAAVPQRADVRDAFCSIQHGSLEALPEGSKIGTGSPRRKAQLLAQRPDLEIVDIRGNVDTRLGMVADGSLDAVILAAAGLGRLARTESITEHLELIDFPTAPGQGALAVEIRDDLDDRNLLAALKKLDHVRSRVTADAERAVLAGLEAGCSAPVGVTAEIDTELFFLTASVYSLDGSAKVTSSHAATPDDQSAKGLADAAAEVAGRVVEELLANGAAEL